MKAHINITKQEAEAILVNYLSSNLDLQVDTVSITDTTEIPSNHTDPIVQAIARNSPKINIIKLIRDFAYELSNPNGIKLRPVEKGVGLCEAKKWVENYFGVD